jgi:integrase
MKGSIIKRGSTYSIVYDLGYDKAAKRKQKWESGFLTRKDAQSVLNERIYEIQTGSYIEPDRKTIGEHLAKWFAGYVQKNLALNTIKGYKVNIEKHIIPAIGHIQLMKLRPIEVQKFYDDLLASGLSATSVLYIHRVLHKALENAVKLQIIYRNVSDYVDLPKKKRYICRVLDENQVRELLNKCHGTEIYVAVLLAVSLGLRRGGVLGLRWDDIDFVNNIIAIRRTQVILEGNVIYAPVKSMKSNRDLLISDRIATILVTQKRWQEENKQFFGDAYQDNHLVICNEVGLPISASLLDKRFKRILVRNELPIIRFHDLRHTNATLMLKKGIPAKIASERLGHSTIGITLDLYSHVDNSMQKAAAEIIDIDL